MATGICNPDHGYACLSVVLQPVPHRCSRVYQDIWPTYQRVCVLILRARYVHPRYRMGEHSEVAWSIAPATQAAINFPAIPKRLSATSSFTFSFPAELRWGAQRWPFSREQFHKLM